jgi:hypothetical protein
MHWRFEDYEVITGYTNVGHVPYASLREFFALVGTGASHEEAVVELRRLYAERVEHMLQAGDSVPPPGSGPARARFASDDLVRRLGDFVGKFWRDVLGTSIATSFVSDESRLSSWEHYVGGRDALLRRVQARYGVDIFVDLRRTCSLRARVHS